MRVVLIRYRGLLSFTGFTRENLIPPTPSPPNVLPTPSCVLHSNNKIGTVTTSCLAGLHMLVSLDLSDNLISTVEEEQLSSACHQP
jgi:hypothetical protein